MIKTIYTCDRCAAEQTTRDQFWSIGIWVKHQGFGFDESETVDKRSIQVCRPCLEALGVYVQPATKANKEFRERTTEDILVELLERIGK